MWHLRNFSKADDSPLQDVQIIPSGTCSMSSVSSGVSRVPLIPVTSVVVVSGVASPLNEVLLVRKRPLCYVKLAMAEDHVLTVSSGCCRVLGGVGHVEDLSECEKMCSNHGVKVLSLISAGSRQNKEKQSTRCAHPKKRSGVSEETGNSYKKATPAVYTEIIEGN